MLLNKSHYNIKSNNYFESLDNFESPTKSLDMSQGLWLSRTGNEKVKIQGALSGLRQFLATETPLKMMKNAFNFTSKAFFILKIFKFLS